ncbi:hypothetical protein DPSP01_011355 [Paraphaeosphaeria sporulosa]
MLSASGFANGEEGFLLHERRIDPGVPIVQVASHHQTSDLSGNQDDFWKSYYLMRSYPWWEFRKGPIYYRGWTLQEQILAPRAVHFGDDQVYWVCKSTTANEVWPRGWMNTPLEPQFAGSSDRILRLNIGNVITARVSDSSVDITEAFRTDHLQASLYDDWLRVIQEYSIRRLTFASDRLPALAGITNGFKDQLKDESIYGLWFGDIHRGLMFEQMRESFGSCIMPTWVGSPTWTWAALHAPVIWDIRLYGRQIYRLCTVDLLRFPRTLLLQLGGKLMKFPSEYRGVATKIVNNSEFDFRESDNKDLAIRLKPDHWFIREHFQWDGRGNIDISQDIIQRQWLDHLLIMPTLCYTTVNEGNYVVMGLLLQAQPTVGRGTYRRVGIVRIWHNYEADPTFDTIHGQLAALQRPLADHHYQETDGKGDYTITVV